MCVMAPLENGQLAENARSGIEASPFRARSLSTQNRRIAGPRIRFASNGNLPAILKTVLAIFAALLSLCSGCASLSSYPAALREFHEFGADLVTYCWGGGEPFQCRDADAAPDERACLRASDQEHGYTLATRRAMSRIEVCMHTRGWIRLGVEELVF